MKNIAIIALLGLVSAESPDCPNSSKVFSYNEKVASAAGLNQITSC
jgi:hypothetical protein